MPYSIHSFVNTHYWSVNTLAKYYTCLRNFGFPLTALLFPIYSLTFTPPSNCLLLTWKFSTLSLLELYSKKEQFQQFQSTHSFSYPHGIYQPPFQYVLISASVAKFFLNYSNWNLLLLRHKASYRQDKHFLLNTQVNLFWKTYLPLIQIKAFSCVCRNYYHI